jgi:hypothetical protein
MSSTNQHIIIRLALKLLLVAAILLVLDVLYRYTFYPADLENNCTLMQRSMLPMEEGDDIVYLGESSNHAVADDEPDKRCSSDMLQDLLPDHRVCNLDKDACHAGVYYDILRNIPKNSPVRTAVVTVNIRSFSTEWIYSDLETALNKERVMMKKAPALYKRMLLAFKGYTHWDEAERRKLVRKELKRQSFTPPAGLPYTTAAQWDKAVAKAYTECGMYEVDTVVLATHYVKCFACQIDENNPRIRDFDRIVKLCRQRGWHLVLHILPDNEEQMTELVGPELVELVRRKGAFVEERYSGMGVTVVNNQGIVADADFRDRDYPTEHYRQAGRLAVATAIGNAID